MLPLSEWVKRHSVSPEALKELQTVLFSAVPETVTEWGMSEAATQQRIRLAAPSHGVRLWRNNVGACTDERGNHLRYGLANESAAMNRVIKSHDLIGITPITVSEKHLGAVLGVFTSIEAKRAGWKYKGNAHEEAQLAWAQLVISLGGIAQFATCPEEIW